MRTLSVLVRKHYARRRRRRARTRARARAAAAAQQERGQRGSELGVRARVREVRTEDLSG